MLRVFARMSTYSPFSWFKKYMLTCILLHVDMYFFIVMHVPNYNTCQYTEECMSTCIQNFNMLVNKSTCQHTKECMSTCILNRTCMYLLCILNRTWMSKKNRMSTYSPFSWCCAISRGWGGETRSRLIPPGVARSLLMRLAPVGPRVYEETHYS